MFKNEFQGGTHVDVFSANGKDPLNKWKNPGLNRDYEKDVKGFIYILEGSTTTAKLQLPRKDSKQSLCLIQRYFIVQVFIPLSKDFAVELTMTDIKSGKRRVVLSTSVKDVDVTPLHVKLPLSLVKRDVWLNLCFDLVSLISDNFPNQTFKSLETVALSGNCKVRRAFTMKNQPFDSSGLPDDPTNPSPCESIPNSLQFSTTVMFDTQVISVPKIRLYLGTKLSRGDSRELSGYWSSNSEEMLSSRRLSARDQVQTHIAFGQKVPVKSRPKNKPLSSSIKDRLVSSQTSIGNQSSRPSARKIRSSIPRLSSPAADKENAGLNASIQVAPAISAREPKQKPRAANRDQHLDELPSMLANLVDELDVVSQNGEQSVSEAVADSSAVFKFSSQPHLVGRVRTESNSTQGEQRLEEDFHRSSSSESDSDERIQESILRETPSPRSNITVNPRLKFSKEFSKSTGSPSRIINQPQASLSPDISRLHTPPNQLYDSKKYSDKQLFRSSVGSRKPPLAQMSLRSSDATLTASVDTLVQTMTRESSEGLGDSLDEKDDKNHVPLESDTSPPQLKDLQKSFNGSQGPVAVQRKSIREIIQAQTIPENPALLSSQFQVASLSDSFEANMLASMKRDAEEEMIEDEQRIAEKGNISFRDEMDESFDASWSTYRNPPPMQPDAYMSEMKVNYPTVNNNTLNGFTLTQSNPRDWANCLSPPTVLPNVRAQQKKESLSDVESVGNDSMGLSNGSSCTSVKSSTTGGETDEEEMLELLYDPCLNCYFDPKTVQFVSTGKVGFKLSKERNKSAIMAKLLQLFLLGMVNSYASATMSVEQCSEAGFGSQLMCSSCNLLDQFDLSSLKENCMQCCQAEADDTETKKFPKAVLEVCG